MKPGYTLTLLATLLTALAGCGGKSPSPSPNPTPDPKPGNETEEPVRVPEWNRDHTLSFLVVTATGADGLRLTPDEASALAGEMRKTGEREASAYLVMGLEFASSGDRPGTVSSVLANEVSCFPIANLSSRERENVLLTREWTPRFTAEPLAGEAAFLTTCTISLRATGPKQIKYELPLGLAHMSSDADADALNGLLQRHTAFPSSIVLLALGTPASVDRVKEPAGYEKTKVKEEGGEILFLLMPKSYLLRSSEKVFDMAPDIRGFLLQVEAGVDR